MTKKTLFTLMATCGLSQAAVISNFDFDTIYTTANDADQGNTTSQTLRLDDAGFGTNGGVGSALTGSGWSITTVDFIHETSNNDTVALQISDGFQTITSDNTIDQGTLSFGDLMSFTFSGDTETFDATSTLTFTFTGGSIRTALSGGGDRGGPLNTLSSGSTNWSGTTDMAIRITAVPEPTTSALLGLGGVALLLRRRK
ncbi:PEP-CTERM sorting domain-containing protein [Rubritalea tangerina]|uniref:PEP-CTERM sorting domain-containing protein n=1 Tax=Rubritalea tangerina TaxID=430798 RepID=A0ABW4Z6U6_9BACT